MCRKFCSVPGCLLLNLHSKQSPARDGREDEIRRNPVCIEFLVNGIIHLVSCDRIFPQKENLALSFLGVWFSEQYNGEPNIENQCPKTKEWPQVDQP